MSKVREAQPSPMACKSEFTVPSVFTVAFISSVPWYPFVSPETLVQELPLVVYSIVRVCGPP